jgi:mono/diheme cytochrome c family protein
LVDPTNVNVDLTLRAKSWLHSNCASCHVEAGGGNAQMELEFNTLLDKMRLLNVKPLHQTFELADPKLVAPGKPTESVLYRRLIIRGQHQMPPVGSNRIDELGAKLIREWIDAMK